MAPQLAEASFCTLMHDRRRSHITEMAKPTDGSAEIVIVGELVIQRLEAPNFGQYVVSKRDGGAKAGFSHGESQPHDNVGQELIIDAHRRQGRPDPCAGFTRVEAGDEPDVRPMQPLNDVVKIITANADVAVRHDDDIVRHRRGHVDEVRDLAVLAMKTAVDYEGDVEVGIGALELANNGDRLVGRVVHPENDLDRSGVILLAETRQILPEPRLRAMQGFKHRHRWRQRSW